MKKVKIETTISRKPRTLKAIKKQADEKFRIYEHVELAMVSFECGIIDEKRMKEISSDPGMIAYCGLYCGACKAYLKEKCKGCHENVKATWCKIRSCCSDNGYLSCADCKEFSDPNACGLFNNFMSKLFALIFRSNRAACIQQIKDLGIQGHADRMAELRLQSLKK